MKAEKMMTRGVAVLLALFLLQLVVAMGSEPAERMEASWINNPHSMEELLGLSQDVVHARVRRVEAAEDLRTDAPGEPEGHDRIPMEVVTLEVVDRMGGESRGGNTIQLFHTGLSKAAPATEGSRRPPGPPPEGVGRPDSPPSLGAADSRTVILSDDPPYQRGQEYVLMVRRGPDVQVGGRRVATQRVVSPEGRYLVKNGRVEPMSSRAEFARQQRGRSVDALRKAVEKGRANAHRPQAPYERRGD